MTDRRKRFYIISPLLCYSNETDNKSNKLFNPALAMPTTFINQQRNSKFTVNPVIK